MQAVLPTWRFFRAGGFDQVRLDTAAELLAIDQLDQKLWVALSCPVKGIEFDARTLTLVDSDADGQGRRATQKQGRVDAKDARRPAGRHSR